MKILHLGFCFSSLVFAISSTVSSVSAATIAVIDSGTDLSHVALKDVAWTNLNDVDDAVDNDDNGYIDDVNGWNFAEGNNRLFDRKLVGTFSRDVYRFFEVQTKKLKGTATANDLDWVKTKTADPKFLSELQLFGNFVHGTHVAGIAAKDSSASRIMPLKLIPTKAPKPFGSVEKKGMVQAAEKATGFDLKKKLVLLLIDTLGSQQAQVFAPISAYLNLEGAQVANCSFGTGFAQAKALLTPLLSKVFGRELPDAELNEYASYFVRSVMKGVNASFIKPAENTLFVIAAGNDGTNNDEFPASPANVKAPNTISVAATNGYSAIASFSNFGTKMVDVAAPGVGILSAAPGGEGLYLSGTSQAAPFVANIAGQVFDANAKLSPGEVRQILMGTSDLKAFLMDKVASGGIVNGKRALFAAKASLSMPVSEAVSKSMREVRDFESFQERSSFTSDEDTFVLPLRSIGI